MRILVTGAGGPAALSFVKAVHDADHDLVMADMDPLATGLHLVADDARVVLPAGDTAGFVRALLDACRRHDVDVVVPTVDAELLPIALAREAFEALGVAVLSGPLEALSVCLDKWRLFETLHQALPLPLTARVEDAAADPEWQPTPRRPIIVKPRRGSGSRGIVRVESRAELTRLRHRPDLIAQRYLPGPEYSVDVLADAAGVPLVAVPRLRLRVDSGVATVACTVRDPALQDLAMALVARLRLPFVSNVQLRLDDAGAPHVLEVNPRLPGTMPLTVAAGVNMPRLALDLLCGAPIPADLDFREIGCVRQLQEHFVDGAGLRALAAVDAVTGRAA